MSDSRVNKDRKQARHLKVEARKVYTFNAPYVHTGFEAGAL